MGERSDRPRRTHTSLAIHYVGSSLIITLVVIGYLIESTLTYEGVDLAQAAVLINGPVSIGTLLVGVISGIAIGKHMGQPQDKKEASEPTVG